MSTRVVGAKAVGSAAGLLVAAGRVRVAIAAALFVIAASGPASASVSSLVLVSEPGDFVGQGQTLNYAPPAATFAGQAHYWVGFPNGGQMLTIWVTTANAADSWSLRFAAPANALLTPGAYPDALESSSPTATHPSLSVAGQARGCSNGVGSFVVLESVITSDYQVLAFRAIFEQRCGATEPALRGEIRFNATVPFEMSAPLSASALAGDPLSFGVVASGGAGAIALSTTTLPQGASFIDHLDGSGTFAWATAPGQAGIYTVEFRGEDTAGAVQPAFTAVRIRPRNDDIASAQPLTGVSASATILGTTAGATKQPSEFSHGFASAGQSVWYRFTVPVADRLVLDTAGSASSVLLAVYADLTPQTPPSLLALSIIATSKPGPGPARVVFDVVPGLVYYVAIDGSMGDIGGFQLNWRRAELTRLLWRHENGAMAVWAIDVAGGIASHATFGPFPGWEPIRLAVRPDRKTNVLWRHSTGMLSFWTLDTALTLVSHRTFGPFNGWTASDMTVASDGQVHLAWTHTTGVLGLWLLPRDALSVTSTVSYGPYSGWEPVAIGVDTELTRQSLWRATTSAVGVWREPSPYGAPSAFQLFGPFAGWTPIDLAAGTDLSARVLWRHQTGAIRLWRVDPGGSVVSVNYGPYAGWEAVGLGMPVESPNWGDYSPRMLWRHAGGGIAVWKTSLIGESVQRRFNYGPFEGWRAIDIAVGPE